MSEKTRVEVIRFYSSRRAAAIACMLPVVPMTIVIGGINLLNRENPFWLNSFNAFWIAVLPLIAAGVTPYLIRDAILHSSYLDKGPIGRGAEYILLERWDVNFFAYCVTVCFFALCLIVAPNLLKLPIAALCAAHVTILHFVAPLNYLKGDDSED